MTLQRNNPKGYNKHIKNPVVIQKSETEAEMFSNMILEDQHLEMKRLFHIIRQKKSELLSLSQRWGIMNRILYGEK